MALARRMGHRVQRHYGCHQHAYHDFGDHPTVRRGTYAACTSGGRRCDWLRVNRTPRFLYEASAHAMKIAAINFPSPLLSALRDGELVIFAGAGVSMGEPACLPSFKTLAEKIAQGTNELLQNGEPEDRFLGRLQQKGVKVHKRAVQELSRNNPKPTDLHKNLLRPDVTQWWNYLGIFPVWTNTS